MDEIVCFFCQIDLASLNVYENLENEYEVSQIDKEFLGRKVHYIDTNSTRFWLVKTDDYVYKNGDIYSKESENIFPNAKLAVIVGFHSGKSGAILTVHSIGKPQKEMDLDTGKFNMAMTSCKAIKNTIKYFVEYSKKFNLSGFDITQEATHGSPNEFLIPIIDFEIGSTDKEYKNKQAGKVLAHTLMRIDDDLEFIPSIGIGGLHYADKFMKVNSSGKYAVGHVFPSSSLKNLSKELIECGISSTTEGCKALILDKKERGEYKSLARKIADELGLDIVNHNVAAQ